MPPKQRRKQQTGKAIGAAANDDVTIANTSVTTALNTNRIKTCLYREEENMAKLKAPALKLIATTTALFLKSLVQDGLPVTTMKTTTLLPENVSINRRTSKRKRESKVVEQDDKSAAAPIVEPILYTLDMLKTSVATSSNSTYGFLADSLQDVKDRRKPFLTVQQAKNNKKEQKKATTKNKQQILLGKEVADIAAAAMTGTSSTNHLPKIAAAKSNCDNSTKGMDDLAEMLTSQSNHKESSQGDCLIQEDEEDYD